MPGLGDLDPSADRFRIREMRARPVNRARNDLNRDRVFKAALGQFDELLDAAAVAGPASRPLPLYYALNQAGRAIIAAYQVPGRPWTPTMHGLTAKMSERGDLQSVSIATQARASESGTMHLLAEAMDTPRLQHPTFLANVWGAIPHLPSPGLGAGTMRPQPLKVNWAESAGFEVTLRLEHPYAPPKRDEATIRKIIRDHFPRAATGLVVTDVERAHDHWDAVEARLHWQSHPRLFAHQYLGEWWLLPKLNKHADVLSGFMLWWTLLLALSEIARYHPAEWTSALDPDSAWTTVPIEEVLQQALAVVPHLVLEALRRENRTT